MRGVGVGWDVAPEGVTYYNFFHLMLITLVIRQLAENFVEIRYKLPEISPILKCGGVELPYEGVIYFDIFWPTYHFPLTRLIYEIVI